MSEPKKMWNDTYDEAISEGKRPQVAGTIADDEVLKVFGELKRPETSKDEMMELLEEEG